jgi:DNA-binding transcriptional ArsR family regulator
MRFSAELTDHVSEIFKVLSEPMRLKLLDALRDGEKSVTELIQLTSSQQANVSKHLGIMRKAGVVVARRKGLNIFYSVKEKRFYTLCDNVCDYLARRHEEERELFASEK